MIQLKTIDLMFDFSSLSTRIRWFYVQRLGNHAHWAFIFIVFLVYLFLKSFSLYMTLLNKSGF